MSIPISQFIPPPPPPVILFLEPSPSSVVGKIGKYINNWNQTDYSKCSKECKQSGSLGKGEINPNTTKEGLERIPEGGKFMLGLRGGSFLWERTAWAGV